MYRRNNLPKAKPRTKKSEKNRYRNVIMNFRVTTEEKEKIDTQAQQENLKTSTFIRKVVLDYIQSKDGKEWKFWVSNEINWY